MKLCTFRKNLFFDDPIEYIYTQFLGMNLMERGVYKKTI